tara:strand:+ start:1121 stop:1378 length:258 start_codon:yes stop_codon:yes gene_type:complete
MKNYFEVLKKKLKEHINFEELDIVDNTHLHTGHKSFSPGKLHLRLKFKSKYLKSINNLNAQRLIMKTLKDEFKTKIHALEISIEE